MREAGGESSFRHVLNRRGAAVLLLSRDPPLTADHRQDNKTEMSADHVATEVGCTQGGVYV